MNHNKYLSAVVIVLIGMALSIFIYACGQTSRSNESTSTGNYTIQGKASLLASAALRAAGISTVTHIVAIGSNGEPFLADFDSSTGNFTVRVNKGVPYTLGFYNKSGGKITLLGYLKQAELNWHSLPLVNPTGEETDLGTVEVNSTSVEATSSVNVTSLISQMNLVNETAAKYYGDLDETMAVYTSLDVDDDGEFDFLTNKRYLFSTYFSMSGNFGSATGEIASMLNGHYNENYKPCPNGYSLSLSAVGDPVSGALATFYFPQAVNAHGGSPVTNVAVSAESNSGASFWSYFSKVNNNLIVSPEVVPAGTYTVGIGAKTYTFKNYMAPNLIKVNANNGIIFPIFNLVTNEAGYITTINYKWMILENGSSRQLTSAEDLAKLKTTVEDTTKYTPAMSATLVHPSPWISLLNSSGSSLTSDFSVMLDREGSTVDISSQNVKLADLHHIQASYNLTSRVVCKFDMF